MIITYYACQSSREKEIPSLNLSLLIPIYRRIPNTIYTDKGRKSLTDCPTHYGSSYIEVIYVKLILNPVTRKRFV